MSFQKRLGCVVEWTGDLGGGVEKREEAVKFLPHRKKEVKEVSQGLTKSGARCPFLR